MKILVNLMVIFLFACNLVFAQGIFEAVQKGDLAKVKELVEKDPQLVKANKYFTESSRSDQSTLLHVAGELDNEVIARYLIEKGADINALDGASLTPLMYAGIKVAKLLVEKGVDINFVTPNGNQNALLWLFFLGKAETAEYLIDQGIALPDWRTPSGGSLLSFALQVGSIKYLDKCFQMGLNPLYESESKSTILHLAAAGNSIELINKLITLGLPLNKTNIYGWTPLHTAAFKGNKNIVELLIQKGSDKNARSIDGSSPYNLAFEENKTDVVDYLISVGADKSLQKFPDLTGEYLGQTKPGKEAVPFAPGIVAIKNDYHGSISFSPDGNEAYWSELRGIGEVSTKSTKIVNGIWKRPETFKTNIDVPFISPDGNKLYFTPWRTQTKWGVKTIVSEMDKNPAGWSEPKPLPDIINSIGGIYWQVSVDRNGNLYFGAGQNGTSAFRIYYSEYKNGTYCKPVLMENLNEVDAHSPYIAPDGSYLIITKRSGFNILFKKNDGSWTKGCDLNSIIGIGESNSNCPIVTHDGKYLFFLKSVDDKIIPYWVDASFIEELRKTELAK